MTDYFTNAIAQIRQATEDLKESNDRAEAIALQRLHNIFEQAVTEDIHGSLDRKANGYSDTIINARWEGFLLAKGYSANEIRAMVMEGEADQLKRERSEQAEANNYKDRDPQND